jgi:3'-5' exoribonuclease
MNQTSLVNEIKNQKGIMKETFIKDLKTGDKLSNVMFAVRTVRKGRTSNNKDYIDVLLADRTGEIQGKIWEDNLDSCDKFEIGNIVNISGNVGEFRDKPQLTVTFLQRAEEFDVGDFLPKSEKDVEKMYKNIELAVAKVKNEFLVKLLNKFYADQDTREQIKKASAAAIIHHACVGGLVEHMSEMLNLSQVVKKEYPNLDMDIITTGILLHDIGKIKELGITSAITRTLEGSLVGHLVIGANMVSAAIDSIKDFPEDLKAKILHLIVSHHGKLEFGSPIVPMTREAIVLCQLDDLSTKTNIAYKMVEDNKDNGLDFSDRHFALETKMYLK